MNDWLGWVLVATNIAVMPYFLLLLGTAAAALLARRKPVPAGEPVSRFLVVIPAHDEEVGIAATVASCRAADYPESLVQRPRHRRQLHRPDSIGRQRTPGHGSSSGSTTAKKSKGYAIEYLIGRLVESGEFEALDAFVLVDADTTIDAGLLRRFDAGLRSGQDWIQCYYTVANPDQCWRTRLMTYAFSLFNGVLPLGQDALGAARACAATGCASRPEGCGAVRGRRTVWSRTWNSPGSLRLDGEKIAFEPDARVHGAMVGSGGPAAASQRRRWEFGRGDIRRKYLPRLLRSDRIGWWEKLVSVCEITLPTMSGLFSLYLILMALDLFGFAVRGRWASVGVGPARLRDGHDGLGGPVCHLAFLRHGSALEVREDPGVVPRLRRLEGPGLPGREPKAWVRTARAAPPETL